MLDPQRLAPHREEKREELFIERYARLLAWALQLTNQHRASAEDLVQDAFIQFVLGRTSLEEIENIDGYLRRMLRYMHLSRMSRSAQKVFDGTLSITDYDSFHVGWRAIEAPRRLQVQEELWQICDYVCSRKETSRAGAVLILRFFHEYYPSEIARVLCSSRHCVDQWQRLVRSELKLYLAGPGRLRFVTSKVTTGPAQSKIFGLDGDLIGELRQMIFRSRQGDCLLPKQLQDIYQPGNVETLATTKLAHIVSCRSCLDLANQILGLPLLAERCQSESVAPETPSNDKPGGGSSGGGTIDLRTKYRQRLREVVEHKPQELRIVVNGSLVSSLKVSSDLSELDLNLGQEETVEFVEVFSEQDVQLLFLSVSQTAGSEPEQWARIELSDGRRLEACLRVENGPTLNVIYEELALHGAEVPTPLKLVKEVAVSSLLSGVHSSAESGDPGSVIALELSDTHSRSRFGRFFCALKHWTRARMAPHDAFAHAADGPNGYASPTGSLLSLTSPWVRNPLWARPGWLTGVVSVVAVSAFLFFRTSMAPTLTATNLLQQASVAEEISGRVPDQVTHRFIDFEERRHAEKAVISRRKVEIWQDSARGDRAQRLYDESNRLIAGAWQKAHGSRIVYHHGARSRPQSAPTSADELLLNPDDIWQLDLSAKAFSSLIAGAADAQLVERTAGYVITYDKDRAIGASRLLKATLTLSRTDLHTIEQTLLVERGGELREYRFIEASIEYLPQKDVAPAVFEPELELMGHDKATGRRGEAAIVTPSPPLALSPSPHTASAELEVDVAYLLNQAKAARSEQVSLSRTASGLLRIEGVVETEQRKAELLLALAPVSNNPAVRIEIGTVAEAMRRQVRGSSDTVTIRDAEETTNTVAVDNELRDYLSRRDAALQNGSNLDEAVRSFSSRTVNRSYRALFHAIELKRLVNRFANVDMRTLAPDARAKWLQMVREHAAAFERETAALRQDMRLLFFSGSPSVAVEEIEIAGDVDLASAVERLYKLAVVNNEAIRSAFTISAQSSSAVKSSQFWRSLTSAEKFAARIKKYPG